MDSRLTADDGPEHMDDSFSLGAKGIAVRNLAKTFTRQGSREGVRAIDGITLDVSPGELVILLGPSGCGKTTLLRCVAGLEHAEEGQIHVGGKLAFSSASKVSMPASKRDLSMIFQAYALWPHMTVFENVAYPLRCRGVRRRDVLSEKVGRALAMVGLDGLGREHPGTLSGGQQQRLALARALVSDPAVILFDEPLSNVDAKVRHQLREEIREMHERVGFAALYVTHDQDEALSLGTRIAVLNEGKLIQSGTPEEIYHKPATKYVAEFVGRANTLPCSIVEVAQGEIVTMSSLGRQSIAADGSWTVGAHHYLMIRPEDVELAGDGDEGIRGRLVAREFRGFAYDADVALHDGTIIRISIPKSGHLPQLGSDMTLRIRPLGIRVLSE